jgi:hypothetical protein
LSRHEGGIPDRKRDFDLAAAPLTAFLWLAPDGQDAEFQSIDFNSIANCPVDDDPLPSVVHAQACDHVAHESYSQRPGAVDHQHTPMPRLFEAAPHQCVIFERFYRCNLTTEGASATELLELNGAGANFLVKCVHEVGCLHRFVSFWRA